MVLDKTSFPLIQHIEYMNHVPTLLPFYAYLSLHLFPCMSLILNLSLSLSPPLCVCLTLLCFLVMELICLAHKECLSISVGLGRWWQITPACASALCSLLWMGKMWNTSYFIRKHVFTFSYFEINIILFRKGISQLELFVLPCTSQTERLSVRLHFTLSN